VGLALAEWTQSDPSKHHHQEKHAPADKSSLMPCLIDATGAYEQHQTDRRYVVEVSLCSPKDEREDSPSQPIEIFLGRRDDRGDGASPSTPAEPE